MICRHVFHFLIIMIHFVTTAMILKSKDRNIESCFKNGYRSRDESETLYTWFLFYYGLAALCLYLEAKLVLRDIERLLNGINNPAPRSVFLASIICHSLGTTLTFFYVQDEWCLSSFGDIISWTLSFPLMAQYIIH